MIHGWPGSFFEFTKVIGPLTEPTRFGANASDAFHVVALSLPGYGFSESPHWRIRSHSNGADRRAVDGASRLHTLRRAGRRLGRIDRSPARSGRSVISLDCTATCVWPMRRPGRIRMKECPPKISSACRPRRPKRDRAGLFPDQSTRPMTLGYGLNDSPAGLAAWIVEKFRAWSDSGGDVEKKFTKDELLTNIMIYWVTESGPSSVRLYFENRVDSGLTGRVEIPFACARFPREMFAIVPTGGSKRSTTCSN